eukprot:scaffold96781_cov15-Tisochrysis_lutea.AAC.1
MQPMLLRGSDSFSTWALPKLKGLELLSLLEGAVGSVQGACMEGSKAKLLPERVDGCQEELMDPMAHGSLLQ